MEDVTRPHDRLTIGTKWVFTNKLDESDNVVRNKTRLASQGYNQIDGIDFEEISAPVAWLETILMILAFASFKNFNLFQMDVKSTLLDDFNEEDVYVEPPPSRFVDPTHLDYGLD